MAALPTTLTDAPVIHYPESDGHPIADNTLQFQWIVLVKENLDALFYDQPAVFVAGDLLWYPVEGHPEICRAPDALVAFGRPKGQRGSYRQWEEQDIAPQVVFEILSPGNTTMEMTKKLEFYDIYGVEEYYCYDPDSNHLLGWLRTGTRLHQIATLDGWHSPRLGIHFDLSGETLQIIRPDGQRFLGFAELERRAIQSEQRAIQSEQERDHEKVARQQAEARIAQLTARLRELGIDPEPEQ